MNFAVTSHETPDPREVRREELGLLYNIERSLPPERRTKRLEELRLAVFDRIEAGAVQQKYRRAYYLYQSALSSAKYCI